ncbi:MAG: methionyl-tRNA formyltransferase [Clostridiales bacterium]|nr:methionyl-tRNA formyltransferase [Clostridiales bacterium]
MNIVFMGTPDFAVPCLDALIKSEHKVIGVFTQPDKPKGRKQILTPPPVKELALQNGIEVYQPSSMRTGEAFDIIKKLNPDLIVVVAFGQILPKEILEFPKYKCINVHGSVLPKYRGAAPIQQAVLDGEKESGVTTMLMDEGLDTGDILKIKKTDIGIDETAGELFDRLSLMGAELMLETIADADKWNEIRIKQDDSKSCYAHMLDKSMCKIDWNNSAISVHNQIRGLSPWPVANCIFEGKTLKIHKARLSDEKGSTAGVVVSTEKNPVVSCGDSNCIELVEVQYEGGKRMKAEDFFRGHKLNKGEKVFE